MIACLVGEPFLLRPWEVAEMTDRQLLDLYFCPRDKFGRPVPDAPPAPARVPRLTRGQARARFLRAMLAVPGTTPATAMRAWREREARRAARREEGRS